jgi:hypothetical protein
MMPLFIELIVIRKTIFPMPNAQCPMPNAQVKEFKPQRKMRSQR